MRNPTPLLVNGSDFPPIRRQQLTTLQVNLGYLCNQSCSHCHVNAGPHRKEQMPLETVTLVVKFLEKKNIQTLDLTGGAPEMNPHFKTLVTAASELTTQIIDRCNLTILLQPGYEELASFLAKHKVKIIASLPCYQAENVNQQRGKDVFEHSITALQLLNKLGYGRAGSTLELDLVYNPTGPFLPPAQTSLETEYKQVLKQEYQIEFNRLLTLTNMPIARFGSSLLAKGLFDEYMQLLRNNYEADNLKTLMCRTTLSIDWQGFVYDCDFNQMLGLPIAKDIDRLDKKALHLSQLLTTELCSLPITTGNHCYGCTAGQGSSCGGALQNENN